MPICFPLHVVHVTLTGSPVPRAGWPRERFIVSLHLQNTVARTGGSPVFGCPAFSARPPDPSRAVCPFLFLPTAKTMSFPYCHFPTATFSAHTFVPSGLKRHKPPFPSGKDFFLKKTLFHLYKLLPALVRTDHTPFGFC